MASNAAFSVCNSPEAEGVMMSQSFRPPGPPLRPAGFAGDSRAAGAGGPSCDAGLGGQPPGWAAPRTASATPGGEAWRSTGENGGRSNSNAWAGDHSTFSSSAGPQRPPWPDAPIPPAALVGSPMPANRPAVDIGPPLQPAGSAGDSRAAGAGGPSCDAGLGGQPPGWAAPRTASATPGGEAWRSTGENGGRSNSNAWAGDHSTFSSSAGPQRPPWPDAPIPPAALVGSPMPADRPAVDIEEDNGVSPRGQLKIRPPVATTKSTN
eukprot:GHVT01092717.1.p1 GENE.GHVT01092717.1~~GHVT01092717.1.p1  ORF type:complete len:265 (+),score=65.81 GHVT01092717.1:1178-1972(+)